MMWPWDPSPLICHDVPLRTASQQGVVPLFLPMYLSLDSHDHGKGRWADFIFSLSEGPLWVPLQGSLRYQWNVSVWTSPVPTWVRTPHRADLSCLRSILFYFHYVAFTSPRKKKKKLSHVRLFVTPWPIACQPPPSMRFSMQEYWGGLPFPSPRDLPSPGIEPGSLILQADSLPSEPPGKSFHLLAKNPSGCLSTTSGNE